MNIYCSKCGEEFLKSSRLAELAGWKYIGWNTGMAPAGRKAIWECCKCGQAEKGSQP